MPHDLSHMRRKGARNAAAGPRSELPDDLWLNALPDGAPLVASAPLAPLRYGASVRPVSQYVFDQMLLGFEAQLSVFAHLVRQQGRCLNLVAMPEAFGNAISRAALGADPQGGVLPVHLRFGPVREARVLKGVRNLAVLAEDPARLPVEGTDRPLGSDTQLPAAFGGVLMFGPRRLALLRAGDAVPLQAYRLPGAGAHADLDVEAHGDPHDLPGRAPWPLIPGLRIRSLAEYDPADWMRPPTACEELEAGDWRRCLALTDSGTDAGFVLVPWNLANPASIVPDLVRKLLRWECRERPESRVVLFPFNATPVSGRSLGDLVDSVAGFPAARRQVFVARLQSLREARALRSVFPLAWIEADDPESGWTAQRLSHLGLQLGVIGEAAALSVPASAAVAPDEPLRIERLDSYGPRSYAARTLSVRALGVLLARSRVQRRTLAVSAPVNA